MLHKLLKIGAAVMLIINAVVLAEFVVPLYEALGSGVAATTVMVIFANIMGAWELSRKCPVKSNKS